MTIEMSESSSLHSAKLVSLARSLSGLGFDAANGGPASPSGNDEPPLPVWHLLSAPSSHSAALASYSNVSTVLHTRNLYHIPHKLPLSVFV